MALLVCAIAFVATFVAGRRSLVAGLGAVIAVGYFYGILRANLASTFSHFIFDAAVAGLYLTQLFRPLDLVDRIRIQPIRNWLVLLAGWPFLLLLLPLQDPMVQMVGLRAHVYFLPFLLLGARLDREDLYRLALVLAGLNLAAFAFALGEFFFGLPYFYPRNEVTELVYRSNDVRSAGSLLGAFRIPATFANSSQYGGTMIITLPVILGAWFAKRIHRHRVLFACAMAASVLGVFFSASRTNLLVLGVLIMVSLVSGRMGVVGRVGWVAMLAAIGLAVSTNERLFLRLMSLNADTILERLSWSMNAGVLELVTKHPMGNGLGGGGSSIPHFLLHLVRNPMPVENQYASIMLEQGLPGLLIWLAFIAWVLTRGAGSRDDPWHLARRLGKIATAAFLATGLIGLGLFTAIPFAPLLFIWMAWLGTPQREQVVRAIEARGAPAPTARLAYHG
ncbi:MAG TPA: hypothetical protein VHG51_17305 [Longimicrobiaceae bacterium]|nr:hypothetical protein [Longimicrobiaceae bacterium]